MWENRCIQCDKVMSRFDGDEEYHAIRLCQCLTNRSINIRLHPENYLPRPEKHYRKCPA